MTACSLTALRAGAAGLLAAWYLAASPPGLAQQPPPPPPGAPPAAAPAEAPAGPTAMANPSMAGPLAANPDPWHLDVTPYVGTVYVTGAFSGLGLLQNAPVKAVHDHTANGDISNAQAALQTTEGWFQFFLEPGAYNLPVVGVPFTHTGPTTNLFTGLPIAWGKIQPVDYFNIQGGKLPTLIGAEYMFTFQNMNIQRGLLWNQEPVVSRGVQLNLTTGPVAWALSGNDGYYSGDINWVSGSATWTIDKANSLVIAGGGALSRFAKVQPSTPLAQQNSALIDVSYTYNAGPWTITPYLQFTHIDKDKVLGFGADASTIGGAILANYKINDWWNLAGRWEYISSSGSAAKGAPDLLGYGPGSDAMSFTLTPTWQNGVFFARGEASVTEIFGITPGSAFVFGTGTGKTKTQGRFLLETGVIF